MWVGAIPLQLAALKVLPEQSGKVQTWGQPGHCPGSRLQNAPLWGIAQLAPALSWAGGASPGAFQFHTRMRGQGGSLINSVVRYFDLSSGIW